MNKKRWFAIVALGMLPLAGAAYYLRLHDSGQLEVSVDDGRVTVKGKHVDRIQVLRTLAEKLRFQLFTGRIDAKYLDLDIRRESPEVALHTVLAGVRYATEMRFDDRSKRHELEALSVGAQDERYPGGGASTSESAMGQSFSVSTSQRLPSPAVDDGRRAPLPMGAGIVPTTPPQGANPPQDVGYVPRQNAPFMGMEPHVDQSTPALDDGFSQADAVTALKSDDPEIRAAAIESVEPTRGGISTLAAEAEHDSVERNRALAVHQLGKGRGFEVTSALLSALDDPSKNVVSAALDALASTGDHTLAGRIAAAVKDPTDATIKEHLQSALNTLEHSVPMHAASNGAQTGATGTGTGTNGTQTGASATQSGTNGAQTGESATQTGANAPQAGANAAQTGAAAGNGNQGSQGAMANQVARAGGK